jgi:glycosyltransferase involved in cell wall biosynthesis
MVTDSQGTRIGVLATAQQRNGGTLPYTLSMIDALRWLPAGRYALTIFTTAANQHYDQLGLPVVKLAGGMKLAFDRLLSRDPFEAVDKVIAPVYSTILLATRRPFAFTLHDMQEKHFPNHFSPLTRGWRHATNSLLATRAKQIICESDNVKLDILRYLNVPTSRVAIVPAPPPAALRSVSVEPAVATALRAKFNLPSVYIFYPAQFWPHKNHLRLIEAFARIAKQQPGCALVLTGQKRFDYDKVMRKAQELNVLDRVFHVGHVDQLELSALYQGATIVAIPTLFESISLPIYEAFTLGTAVCASNVAALPQQVGNAGLLFDPLSIDDMAGKISAALSDPSLRQQLIERGLRRMVDLTHTSYAQKLAAVVERL